MSASRGKGRNALISDKNGVMSFLFCSWLMWLHKHSTMFGGCNWGGFLFYAADKGVRAGVVYEPSLNCAGALQINLDRLRGDRKVQEAAGKISHLF